MKSKPQINLTLRYTLCPLLITRYMVSMVCPSENLLYAQNEVNAVSIQLLLGTHYPLCLQSATNTNSFKRQLKTHLFTEAFQSFCRFNCSYTKMTL